MSDNRITYHVVLDDDDIDVLRVALHDLKWSRTIEDATTTGVLRQILNQVKPTSSEE
jgi:hypothetical protein